MASAAEQDRSSVVPAAEIRSELTKITGSPDLQRSPQLQRFLCFLVEEALAGRGDRLKEYVVGVEVFGRPANYDPRLDSLVRVEAHRLRATLEDYYRNQGRGDSIAIQLSKGSYVPSFQYRNQSASPSRFPVLPVTKGLTGKWLVISAALAALALAGVTYRLASTRVAPAPPVRTVAVLPFQNLSSHPESEFFCFGLMDEITTDLAKAHDLRVIARTSAERFQRGDDISTIARQLKVDAIVEGSVRMYDDRVRITAQLINSRDALHLWSETYERPAADLLQVQEETALAVARAVASRLEVRAAETRSRVPVSRDAEAKELYWKGSYFRAQRGRENLNRGREDLELAVQKDAQFAAAYSALADVYASLAYESNGGPVTIEFMSRARHNAARALELDDTRSEALGALGTVQFFYDWDRAAAESSFRRALELNPSDAKTRLWYALALVPQRRFDEALAQAQQARELDPLSYTVSSQLGVAYYCAGYYDRAIEYAREMLSMDPNFVPAHALLGMSYEARQNYGGAIEEYRTGLRLAPTHSFLMGRLGHAYAMAGQLDEAAKLLKDMLARRDPSNFSDLHISYIYMGLGDREGVFQELGRAYQRRDPDLPYMNSDPILEPLRPDPRFTEMLRKIGLASDEGPPNRRAR
jgi:TolB-like protein/Flp pilus assembly protein TadD